MTDNITDNIDCRSLLIALLKDLPGEIKPVDLTRMPMPADVKINRLVTSCADVITDVISQMATQTDPPNPNPLGDGQRVLGYLIDEMKKVLTQKIMRHQITGKMN